MGHFFVRRAYNGAVHRHGMMGRVAKLPMIPLRRTGPPSPRLRRESAAAAVFFDIL
jgi:hypothetical protein